MIRRHGIFSAYRRCLQVALAVYLAVVPVALVTAQDSNLEYAIKANYLYKFEPFVDWPPEVFETATSPLVICIAGRDPFGDLLDRTVANVTLGARHVRVQRLGNDERNPHCHIVFIGGPVATVKKWLAMLREKPMLTVTELNAAQTNSASTETGIINFVTANERVRFAIDNGAAARAGLVLSTKLLALATAVRSASNEVQR